MCCDLRLMLTQKHLLPYSNNLRCCYHRSNKGVWLQTCVSHIELLESRTHVIHNLLTNEEEKNDA